ncbi:hypothetical protein RM550_34880 [Streptomyces sp. DSM 41527]|uniref:Uncharacterized protein n=1 Tax=Streptomyces mooreae TaxID=3075523 RepID=A0ABU2TIU5_9ACTN|nr:hypothetical protein [Streptomyces sp. DSM 41527]MDT0460847.1 hypothetical protein [Streptomyces sp. DSM 41527]
MRPVADALANGLITLLGPDADWRANGYAAYREEHQRRCSWAPVTEAAFDAAVAGIDNGHSAAIIATGED